MLQTNLHNLLLPMLIHPESRKSLGNFEQAFKSGMVQIYVEVYKCTCISQASNFNTWMFTPLLKCLLNVSYCDGLFPLKLGGVHVQWSPVSSRQTPDHGIWISTKVQYVKWRSLIRSIVCVASISVLCVYHCLTVTTVEKQWIHVVKKQKKCTKPMTDMLAMQAIRSREPGTSTHSLWTFNPPLEI